jgi:peptidoglycan/LPS O-acetylase OafA/YrhL
VTAVTGRYIPALDGLRAVAVAGVVGYHLGLGWASGGYLGVDLFFVLSGFLITTLLLEEWLGDGGIGLGAFWGRRARRLLPALLVLLVAIGLFVVLEGRLGGPDATAGIDLSALRGDALAALFYVANWHLILAHQSYFAHFSLPSPLEHTWSLAIEEQFYLVWPPLLVLLLPRIRAHWRGILAAVTVAGGLASMVAMALVFHPGHDPSTAYFGTETRLFDMLAGAAVAAVAAGRRQPRATVARSLHVAAAVAAVGLAAFWAWAGGPGGLPPGWMFRGGFALCAVLAAVVVADLRQVRPGALGRALALRPLRWVGMISYGIYLWHWPVIVYLDQARTGLSGAPLDAVRIAVIGVAATASFYLVERPVRRMRFTGVARRALVPGTVAAVAAVAVVATVPALSVPTAITPAAAAAVPPPPATTGSPSGTVASPSTTGPRSTTGRPSTSGPPSSTASSSPSGSAGALRRGPVATASPSAPPIALTPGRTISPGDPLRVLLIGDSVMGTAEPALDAALSSTGEVELFDHAFDGWGLTTDGNWRRDLTALVAADHPDVVMGTWSWDDTEAEMHPAAYRALLLSAVADLTAPGDGVSGVVLLQYPPLGGGFGDDQAQVEAQRDQATAAWERIAASVPGADPGRVAYLPVGTSVALLGRYSAWLPPATDPGAPRSAWVRVRMLDTVHLCPPGAARYAAAVLADLTSLFHLPPASSDWSTGSWVDASWYTNPPGACPDDHPPG